MVPSTAKSRLVFGRGAIPGTDGMWMVDPQSTIVDCISIGRQRPEIPAFCVSSKQSCFRLKPMVRPMGHTRPAEVTTVARTSVRLFRLLDCLRAGAYILSACRFRQAEQWGENHATPLTESHRREIRKISNFTVDFCSPCLALPWIGGVFCQR